jgi:hypothetical protein
MRLPTVNVWQANGHAAHFLNGKYMHLLSIPTFVISTGCRNGALKKLLEALCHSYEFEKYSSNVFLLSHFLYEDFLSVFHSQEVMNFHAEIMFMRKTFPQENVWETHFRTQEK